MIRLCYKTGRLGERGHQTVFSGEPQPTTRLEREAFVSDNVASGSKNLIFLRLSRSGVTQLVKGGARNVKGDVETLVLGPINRSRLTARETARLEQALNRLLFEDSDKLAEDIQTLQAQRKTNLEIERFVRAELGKWLAELVIDPKLGVEVDWQALEKERSRPSKDKGKSSNYSAISVVILVLLGLAGLVSVWLLGGDAGESTSTNSNLPVERISESVRSVNLSAQERNYLVYFEACANEDARSEYLPLSGDRRPEELLFLIRKELKDQDIAESAFDQEVGPSGLFAHLQTIGVLSADLPAEIETLRDYCVEKWRLVELHRAIDRFDKGLRQLATDEEAIGSASVLQSGTLLEESAALIELAPQMNLQPIGSLAWLKLNEFDKAIMDMSDPFYSYCYSIVNNNNNRTIIVSEMLKYKDEYSLIEGWCG